MRRRDSGKSGQVWIETVLYTVIGLSIIAMVLSFTYPKIRMAQEQLLIEQSIATLNNLDTVITTVNDRGPGNVKTYTFSLKRGRLILDEGSETISIELKDIKHEYSEINVPVTEGRVTIITSEGQKGNTVTIKTSYMTAGKKIIDFRVGVEGSDDEIKEFVQATNPYVLSISYGATPGTIVINEGVITS